MKSLEFIWEKLKQKLPTGLTDWLVALALFLIVTAMTMLLFGFEVTFGSTKVRFGRPRPEQHSLCIDSDAIGLDGYLHEQPSIHGVKSLTRPVKFNKHFKGTPTVVVSLRYIDLKINSGRDMTRIDVKSEDVKPEGFNCVFTSWDNQPAGGATAVWIAYGEEAENTP